MTKDRELTELEQLVARLFYNVGIQAALCLEDPNQRFAVEFKSERAQRITKATQFKEIVSVTYSSELDDGAAILVTNPKGSPALARVIMQGDGDSDAVMAALVDAFTKENDFTMTEGDPFPVTEGHVLPEGAGNRFMKLITGPEMNCNHDVAVLFSWGEASGKRITLDLLTWPTDKSSNGQT